MLNSYCSVDPVDPRKYKLENVQFLFSIRGKMMSYSDEAKNNYKLETVFDYFVFWK
jgi:hypothetical protein